MYYVHNAPAFVLGCFRGTATSFAWFRTFIHAKTRDWKAICVEVSHISPDYLHQLPLGTPTGDFEYSAEDRAYGSRDPLLFTSFPHRTVDTCTFVYTYGVIHTIQYIH